VADLADSEAWEVYAWALVPNHFHLLVQTGAFPLSRNMRVLMSGYAGRFNRRHRRRGHVFQNRFNSVVCETEEYFLELLRYLHLNPLRAGIVTNMKGRSGSEPTRHLGIIPQAVCRAARRGEQEYDIDKEDLSAWLRPQV